MGTVLEKIASASTGKFRFSNPATIVVTLVVITIIATTTFTILIAKNEHYAPQKLKKLSNFLRENFDKIYNIVKNFVYKQNDDLNTKQNNDIPYVDTFDIKNGTTQNQSTNYRQETQSVTINSEIEMKAFLKNKKISDTKTTH
jgi:hypothetical protein